MVQIMGQIIKEKFAIKVKKEDILNILSNKEVILKILYEKAEKYDTETM